MKFGPDMASSHLTLHLSPAVHIQPQSSSEPYHLSIFLRDYGSKPLGSPEDKVMKGDYYEEEGQIST
jgi:hypothetical protein